MSIHVSLFNEKPAKSTKGSLWNHRKGSGSQYTRSTGPHGQWYPVKCKSFSVFNVYAHKQVYYDETGTNSVITVIFKNLHLTV